MRLLLRSIDRPARCSEEEFAVILPGPDIRADIVVFKNRYLLIASTAEAKVSHVSGSCGGLDTAGSGHHRLSAETARLRPAYLAA